MLFLEVENLEEYLSILKSKKLTEKFSNVGLSKIVENDWKNIFFT
jgi:hypothetical protein